MMLVRMLLSTSRQRQVTVAIEELAVLVGDLWSTTVGPCGRFPLHRLARLGLVALWERRE